MKKKSLIDYVESACLVIAGIAVMAMMILTTIDVIMRYVFASPLPGMLELSEEYLMVAAIFLPLSYVYSHGGHIKVELLERFFSPGMKAVAEKVNIIISLILFLMITYASIPMVEDAIRISEESRSALHYPMAPAYAMVTIGCFLVCLRAFEALLGKGPLNEHHDESEEIEVPH